MRDIEANFSFAASAVSETVFHCPTARYLASKIHAINLDHPKNVEKMLLAISKCWCKHGHTKIKTILFGR